jgi:hypothetical protein
MEEPLFQSPDRPTCPPLTDAMVDAAETALGVKLPRAYVDALRHCNGGSLRRTALATEVATSWHDDYVEIRELLGIGGENGIDGPSGSRYLVEEWGYPHPSVVICSEGHTAFLLDYRDGVPSVLYVDMRRGKEWTVAPNFETFLAGLVCNNPGTVVGIAGEHPVEELLRAIEGVGVGSGQKQCWGSYSFVVPDCQTPEGEPASIDLTQNQYSDGSGWHYYEHPECPWLLILNLSPEETPKWIDRLRQVLLLTVLHTPPRWPSERLQP